MSDTKHHYNIRRYNHQTLEGTHRIETFSDAVMAIVVTLLVLEVHVPTLQMFNNLGALAAVISLFPKLMGFFVSFVTVSVFWVNHHHFFYPIKKSNTALMWYNNYLLFWIAVIPFATAFTGDYPSIPFVVALYGFVLFMAAVAFSLMNRYVFFHCLLLPESVTQATRIRGFHRSLVGVALYGFSIVTAFFYPTVSLIIFALVPLYYFLPKGVEVGD